MSRKRYSGLSNGTNINDLTSLQLLQTFLTPIESASENAGNVECIS